MLNKWIQSLGLLILIFMIQAATIFPQSGRIRQRKEFPSDKKTDERKSERKRNEELRSNEKVADKKASVDSQTKDLDESSSVIRIESVLIPIFVSVTDAEGSFVKGLRLEDFIVQDNGKTVKVESISTAENLPLRLALLFDNSSSVSVAQEFEKTAAMEFFKQVLRPGKDSAALFSISTRGHLEQPLTTNPNLLIRALERLKKPGGATALFDTIVMASEYLKDRDGKRVIVVISDGDDNMSDSSLDETIRTVLMNNCIVYVIITSDFENYIRTGRRSGNSNTTFLIAERRMQQLAQQTGGALYSPINENELGDVFFRLSSELFNQYVLNYYPEFETLPKGKLRSLSVKIKNRPDLIVRSRQSYQIPN
ncbi:MAG: VWA domain-containing protein [Acidobacteria bacterium]|nr:MAG: VWA domain-containing protein [Acidobacteriota bacterium]